MSGAIENSDVAGDLAALVAGGPGRGDDKEITLFKSVGAVDRRPRRCDPGVAARQRGDDGGRALRPALCSRPR